MATQQKEKGSKKSSNKKKSDPVDGVVGNLEFQAWIVHDKSDYDGKAGGGFVCCNEGCKQNNWFRNLESGLSRVARTAAEHLADEHKTKVDVELIREWLQHAYEDAVKAGEYAYE